MGGLPEQKTKAVKLGSWCLQKSKPVNSMNKWQSMFSLFILPHWYFKIVSLTGLTLTYSTKSYGFLINFSLIMLDTPWLLFSLSTWLFFVLDGFRGSSWDILTKGTLLSAFSFCLKSYGWVVVVVVVVGVRVSVLRWGGEGVRVSMLGWGWWGC